MILLKALALSIFILSIIVTLACAVISIDFASKGDADGTKMSLICMTLPILNIIFIITYWCCY